MLAAHGCGSYVTRSLGADSNHRRSLNTETLALTRRRGVAEEDAEFEGEVSDIACSPGGNAERAEALRVNVEAAVGSGLHLLNA